MNYRFTLLIIFLLISLNPSMSMAEHMVETKVERPVKESISIRQKTQRQQEKWRDDKEKMIHVLESLEQEKQGLLAEKERLAKEIQAAKDRISVKEKELSGIKEISVKIMPFLEETIQWYGEDIETLPFLQKERRTRFDRIATLLHDPDVTISEKFRKTLEALLIEAEYGTTVEVNKESIELDGKPVLVTLFRLGRLNLFYQTLNRKECGFYNIAESRWERLANEDNKPIEQAVEMGLKRRPVEMVMLPVGRVVLP